MVTSDSDGLCDGITVGDEEGIVVGPEDGDLDGLCDGITVGDEGGIVVQSLQRQKAEALAQTVWRQPAIS